MAEQMEHLNHRRTAPAPVSRHEVGPSGDGVSARRVPSPISDGRSRITWLSRAKQGVLQGCVIATLLALAYLGHRSGWRFGLEPPESHTLPPALSQSGFRVVLAPVELSTSAFCEVHQIYMCPADHQGDTQSPNQTPEKPVASTGGNAIPGKSARLPPPRWLGARVEFASAAAFERQTVSVEEVVQGPFRETAKGYGKLTFFPADQVDLKALLPGIIRKLTKRPYEKVVRGEVVAILDSPNVIDLKSDYVKAWTELKAAQQKLTNLSRAPVPEQDKQLARAAVDAATIALGRSEKALLAHGFPAFELPREISRWEDVVEFLRPLGWTPATGENRESWLASFLPITAPFDGVVTDLPVVEGQIVEQNQLICRIVNPARLLLVIFLPGEAASRTKAGLAAEVKVEGTQKAFSARVTWVGPVSDPTTVQVPVHIEIDNASGHLRAGALAEAEIILRDTQEAVLVSEKAVHGKRDARCVFVWEKAAPDAPGGARFSPRMVRVAGPKDGKFEVLAGLLPGERIAVEGSELMWEELEKAVQTGLTLTERLSNRHP